MRPWHADEIPLVTDLYELTMAQDYLQAGKAQEMATFSLFVRKYPPHRGYFVATGLADVVQYLERWHFSPEAIDALHRTHLFAVARRPQALSTTLLAADPAALPGRTLRIAGGRAPLLWRVSALLRAHAPPARRARLATASVGHSPDASLAAGGQRSDPGRRSAGGAGETAGGRGIWRRPSGAVDDPHIAAE